jgi:hypothetical protein
MGRGGEEEGISVRLRATHLIAADGAVTAGAIVNNDGGSLPALQLFRDQASEAVDAAAGSEWDDHTDRAFGVIRLRQNDGRVQPRASNRNPSQEIAPAHQGSLHSPTSQLG